MTTPEDPRKPTPDDPQNPADNDPVATGPAESATPPEPLTSSPTAASAPEPAPTPASAPISPATPTPEGRTDQAEEYGWRAGQKVTALLTGAAALANKVRSEAPTKIREAREKRLAGHRVILTEVDGRAVAVGPYRNDQAAHQDIAKVSGAPRVVELLSPTAHFATKDAET